MKNFFLEYCLSNKYQQNDAQIKALELLISFSKGKFSNNSWLNFFEEKKHKLAFYLYGDVGIGKTMLLNFFFDHLDIPKKRMHFNEFMINFHNYHHQNRNKENLITSFVKNLKKYKLIYLDEFQVTNIVDAMILGKLFETIFKEGIKIIVTSNTKIDDLYIDGLQRDQFLSFISILKKNSIHKELSLENDYRKLSSNRYKRTFYPTNEKNLFLLNQLFRKLTKKKKKTIIKLNIKGRVIKISNFFDGFARFHFNELCDANTGAEDYLAIAKNCTFIVIENIPNFTNDNVNKQQRFITLIDIIYEKKIPLMTSSAVDLENFSSSTSLDQPFKRTLSRLHELTSSNFSQQNKI